MTEQLSNQSPLSAVSSGGWKRLSFLLIAVAVIHAPSLFSPFFLDDYVYVYAGRDLDWPAVVDTFTAPTMDETASSVWWVPTGALPFYRPVGQLSFALDFRAWGFRPFGFHLTNLLLHLICTVLTWRLAHRFFDTAGAFLVAVVFALHPMHTEAVMWVSGRFDLLVCVSMLASVLSYLKWRDGSGRTRVWWAMSWLFFAIGLACKETAIILPAVLAGVECILPHPPRRTRRLIGAASTFGVVTLLYVLGRISLFGGLAGRLPPPYGLDTSSLSAAISGIASSLAQYLLDMVLFIHVEAFFFTQFWRDHPVLAMGAILACAVIILIAIWLAFRMRAFRFGALWAALFTAPALMAMPGERNVYLAHVGVALIFVSVYHCLHTRNRTTVAAPYFSGLRLRWFALALTGVWAVLSVGEQGVMWCVASTGEKVYRDLQARLPDPPPNSTIYVVNQCPINSVGFTQAIRLRYGREDLAGVALTVSPTLETSTTDAVTRTGSDRLRVDRRGAEFFASFVERFHLFGEAVSSLPVLSGQFDIVLIDPPASFEHLQTLEFRLPHPLEDPRVQCFIWDNSQIKGRTDLLRIPSLAELKPLELR